MDHEILVGVLECRTDFAKYRQPFSCRKMMSVAVPVDRLALDVLHHKIGETIGSRPTFEQTSDVGMFEVGKNLSLHRKATKNHFRVHPAIDEFDGDLFLVMIVGAHREIDRAHSTVAE